MNSTKTSFSARDARNTEWYQAMQISSLLHVDLQVLSSEISSNIMEVSGISLMVLRAIKKIFEKTLHRNSVALKMENPPTSL